jgi:hypothetical protein
MQVGLKTSHPASLCPPSPLLAQFARQREAQPWHLATTGPPSVFSVRPARPPRPRLPADTPTVEEPVVQCVLRPSRRLA